MELILHCLTAGVPFMEFGVWLNSVSSRPLTHPVLYLHKVTPDAAPKCISGRTSYLRVRLAFYPYPQLIPSLCNVNGFGPSRNVTFASAWPWVAHTVSGLLDATERPVQTRFRYGSGAERLNLATPSNSSAHSSIGTLSPRRIETPTVCKLMVSVLFHPPYGVLFTFPSRY